MPTVTNTSIIMKNTVLGNSETEMHGVPPPKYTMK